MRFLHVAGPASTVRRVVGALILGCIAATQAHAADPPRAVDDAREAFQLGTVLARDGYWLEALAAFERSARLKPHAVTTFDIGYCERALGHSTRARRMLGQALAENAQRGGAELSEDRIVEAKDYLTEIERRLSRAVVVGLPAGAAVAVDGRPLESPAASDVRPVFVAGTRSPGPAEAPQVTGFDVLLDPGAHVIVISPPGSPDIVVSRTWAPGSTDLLDVALLTVPIAPIPPPVVAREPPSLPPPAPDRTVAYVALATGAAGVVAGSVFGALALRQKARLAEDCPADRRKCPPGSQDDIDRLNAFASTSTVSFAVGAVGLGLGSYLLWSSKKPDAAAHVGIAPGRHGVRIVGDW
jgi:hypothetical protein